MRGMLNIEWSRPNDSLPYFLVDCKRERRFVRFGESYFYTWIVGGATPAMADAYVAARIDDAAKSIVPIEDADVTVDEPPPSSTTLENFEVLPIESIIHEDAMAEEMDSTVQSEMLYLYLYHAAI